MSDYYANGRPKWDDQFRETEWERQERWRKRRIASADAHPNADATPPSTPREPGAGNSSRSDK